MSRPFLELTVLLVLWLIVIVPMIVRRNDEGAQDRSVRRFGSAMRALTRRATAGRAGGVESPSEELFVSGRPRATSDLGTSVRRPIPAAQEALMHPVDRSEMSAARARMMARRRRSLTTLGAGSVIMLLLAFTVGGGLFWTVGLLFVAGLAGYLYFLRSQATKDRARRAQRQERAAVHRPHSYDVTAASPFFAEPEDTVVRIDDDNIELHNIDTVDLTGLYNEEGVDLSTQRRAS